MNTPAPPPPQLLEIPETIHALVAGCYGNLLGLCLFGSVVLSPQNGSKQAEVGGVGPWMPRARAPCCSLWSFPPCPQASSC